MGTPYVQDVGWGVLIASFAAVLMVVVREYAMECNLMIASVIRNSLFLQCVYISSLIAAISLLGVFGGHQFISFQF